MMAAIMIIVPITETGLSMLPFRFGEVSWRFGASGLFSRSLLTPIIGLLLVLVTAVSVEHLKVQRVAGVVALIASLLAFGMLCLFVLDTVQLRTQAPPDRRAAMLFAAGEAVSKLGLFTIVLAFMARSGLKTPRIESTDRRRPRTAEVLIPGR
jgi:hypothetical protein